MVVFLVAVLKKESERVQTKSQDVLTSSGLVRIFETTADKISLHDWILIYSERGLPYLCVVKIDEDGTRFIHYYDSCSVRRIMRLYPNQPVHKVMTRLTKF